MSIVTIPNASNPAASFTPVLAFGGGSTGMASSRTASIEKIGSLVVFELDIFLSAKGSSVGAATISGLTFAKSAIGFGGVVVSYAANLASITGQLVVNVDTSSTLINLRQVISGTATNLTEANFTNSSRIILSGFYLV